MDQANEGFMVAQLRKHRNTICKNLFLEPVISRLFSMKVIDRDTRESIKDGDTLTDKTNKLLDHLTQGGNDAIKAFQKALRETKQVHIAELLLGQETGDHQIMTESHLKLLGKLQSEDVLKELKPNPVIQYLKRDNALTNFDYDQLDVAEKNGGLTRKKLALLFIVRRKEDAVFELLVKALRESNQDNIADLLDPVGPEEEVERVTRTNIRFYEQRNRTEAELNRLDDAIKEKYALIKNSKKYRIQKKLLQSLYEQQKHSEYCDYAIQVGKCRARVHRCVLEAIAPLAKDLLSTTVESNSLDLTEIGTQGCKTPLAKQVCRQVLEHLVEYMYTGQTRLTTKSIKCTAIVASYISMAPLMADCSKYILENLRLSNCIDMWLIAKKSSLSEVEHIGRHILVCRFHDVFKFSREIFTLEPEDIIMLAKKGLFEHCKHHDVADFLQSFDKNHGASCLKDDIMRMINEYPTSMESLMSQSVMRQERDPQVCAEEEVPAEEEVLFFTSTRGTKNLLQRKTNQWLAFPNSLKNYKVDAVGIFHNSENCNMLVSMNSKPVLYNIRTKEEAECSDIKVQADIENVITYFVIQGILFCLFVKPADEHQLSTTVIRRYYPNRSLWDDEVTVFDKAVDDSDIKWFVKGSCAFFHIMDDTGGNFYLKRFDPEQSPSVTDLMVEECSSTRSNSVVHLLGTTEKLYVIQNELTNMLEYDFKGNQLVLSPKLELIPQTDNVLSENIAAVSQMDGAVFIQASENENNANIFPILFEYNPFRKTLLKLSPLPYVKEAGTFQTLELPSAFLDCLDPGNMSDKREELFLSKQRVSVIVMQAVKRMHLPESIADYICSK